MRIWAIGDLHLSFGVKNKSMDVFGPQWENHPDVIASHWVKNIQPEDLILLPGDFSWAMRSEEVLPDLKWLDHLPGTKVMIKGNHDYWWGSLKKVVESLPPSVHVIQNNAFNWKNVSIGGARLWDTPEYSFSPHIERVERNISPAPDLEEVIQQEFSENIFNREVERLKLSLKAMNPKAEIRIAMTHYPPIGADMQNSRCSQILEEHNINICVFGHLHSLKRGATLFGEKNGIRYILTSCDYLRFQPIQIYPT